MSLTKLAAAFSFLLALGASAAAADGGSWTNQFYRIIGTPAGKGSNDYRVVSLVANKSSGFTILFPGGKPKALTFSYDDDTSFDRRFVEIINKHNLKATFNLNSDYLGGNLLHQEVKTLFAGHEVSSHTTDHTGLWNAPDDLAIRLIVPDRIALERLVGYPVRGMAYPSGSVKPNARELFPKIGIAYGRGISDDGSFALDKDVFDWRPTTHHDNMIRYAKEFLAATNTPALLYVWGHAYEFDRDKKWDLLEEFCALVSGKDDIWYATNIQIVDYIEAAKRLIFMADGSAVQNPSAISVWINTRDKAVELKPGKLTSLK